MNLAALPENTKLYELLQICQLDHELVLTECVDGALIMECLDCPFHKNLDITEENFLREQELTNDTPSPSTVR